MIQIHNIDPSWHIFSWEANPYTHDHFSTIRRFDHLNITTFHSAVSTEDGTITLNIENSSAKENNPGKTGTGTSIIPLDQWQCSGVFDETVVVPSIDFSKWILENCNKSDYVVLKMDIEGAEYNVLEKVISSGAVALIDKLYIEWHSRMFPNPSEYLQREEQILKVFADNSVHVENH
jgi:FkbM family methyltransferase